MSQLKNIILILYIILLAGCGSSDSNNETPTPAVEEETSSQPSAKDSLSLDFKSWELSSGVIFIGNFKIKNNHSDYSIKDITIECTTRGGSGTPLNTVSKTVYEVIQPSKSKTVKELNFGFVDGQSATAECKISSAVWN